ncbi:hypothetical protein ACIBCC_29925 [Streptomyces griseus]|uniref:hypothetical protein n=1 Tax=Streptomyces griseus TaxID=1911 RepID=UPI00378B3879
MSSFPPGVLATIRHALVLNLVHSHRRFGDNLPACDLYPDIIRSLKWVHSQDPKAADDVVWGALEHVAGHEGGPDPEAAARCLSFSLTRHTPPFEAWSEDQADRFVAAARVGS